MSVIGSSALAGASGQGGGGYEIERSLRFNSADSSYLNRTPSAASDSKTWTISFWFKLGQVGTAKYYFGTDTQFLIESTAGGELQIYNYTSSYDWIFTTTRKLRDLSAWYHLVLSVDTTQATSTDRVKIYINGELETSFTNNNYPSLNFDSAVNTVTQHSIGTYGTSSTTCYEGYLADIHFIDGQALSASDFGEYDDNNVWQPKRYSGTYGTNGFKLDFSDTSSNAALGTDSSGNSNTWTVNNLFASSGSVPTTPSNGYLDFVMGYYLNGTQPLFLCKDPAQQNVASTLTHGGASGTTWAVDDVLQWAVDQDNGKLWIGRNNTWYSGNPSTATDASMHNWGSGNLYLGKAYDSTDLKLEITASAAYTPPTGYTYWSASSTGSWVGSGNSTSNTANDIFNTPIPTTGKIYIEATIKGGVSVYQTLGLMNVGETIFTIDALRDSPTNGDSTNDTGVGGELSGNYCTWNPLGELTGGYVRTLTDGNLTAGGNGDSIGTITFGSGKTYFELTVTSASGFSQGYYGIVNTKQAGNRAWGSSFIAAFRDTGALYGTSSTGSAPAAAAVGTIYGIAVDVDNQKMFISVNGTWLNSGNPASGTGASFTGRDFSDYAPLASLNSSNAQTITLNTGQRAFHTAAPSGYKCLCTANLSDPTIADGSTAFDAKLYTGNGGTQAVSGLNFSPELTWIKTRSGSGNHHIFDVVRGVNKSLHSDTTAATENTTAGLTSFDSNGFSLGNSNNDINGSGTTFVSWNWDAGSSNTTIAAGDLTNTLYDSSQTWSTYGTFDNHYNTSGYTWDKVFNTHLNFDAAGSLYVNSSTADKWTLTSSIAVQNKIKIYTYGYTTVVVNDGLSDQLTVNSPGNTFHYFEFDFSGNMSNISVVPTTIGGTTGTIYFMGIWIDGKQLVDTAPNVPSIASTVRANPSAGFSIVSYTGDGAAGTIAHNLNKKPDFVITKNLTTANYWAVWHSSLTANKFLRLNLGNAEDTESNYWTDFDSNVVHVPGSGSALNNVNNSSKEYISYCWNAVEGYSAFGKWAGNASVNGPFVYTGFKPSFILLKGIGAAHYWAMHDDARDPTNTGNKQYLWANTSGQDYNGYDIDFLANGFKLRNDGGNWNTTGYGNDYYIFAAFASHPFKTSRAH